MAEYTPLKYYFDKRLAVKLDTLISEVYPSFPGDYFITNIFASVEDKALKERVDIIADELYRALPDDYESAVSILMSILGPENETEEGMFTNGYFLMPVGRYVEKYGLNHMAISMNAIYEITKRHTSEFAIRPYVVNYPDQCLEFLNQWKHDSNSHIRRLVSEGTRPRLPWAKKIDLINGDIHQNLELLDDLINDSSNYVRKSVGNHLNDLTKESPDIVIDWIEERKESMHPTVIKRGLRTQVKQENQRAVSIIDFK